MARLITNKTWVPKRLQPRMSQIYFYLDSSIECNSGKYVDKYVLTMLLIHLGTPTVPNIDIENMAKNNMMT